MKCASRASPGIKRTTVRLIQVGRDEIVRVVLRRNTDFGVAHGEKTDIDALMSPYISSTPRWSSGCSPFVWAGAPDGLLLRLTGSGRVRYNKVEEFNTMRFVTQIRAISGLRRFCVSRLAIIVIPRAAQLA